MFKYKKEDVGLYFACGLVGAGVGVLVGGLITNVLEQHKRKKFQEQIEESVKDLGGAASVTYEDPLDDPEYAERLERLIEEYSPNVVQEAMLRSRVITVDEWLENTRELEPDDTGIPTYHVGDDSPKPELHEVMTIEEGETVDDQFIISSMSPNVPSNKIKTIYWKERAGKDVFSELYQTGGNEFTTKVDDIEAYVSHATWETIKPYLFSGLWPIFVYDVIKDKRYRFEEMNDMPEEPAFIEEDES